jgi:hypothetical protein
MAGADQMLSAEQVFRAMFVFLQQYCERGGRKGELAAVLSDIQMMPDGRPAGPAAWEDWLKAVQTVLENSPH